MDRLGLAGVIGYRSPKESYRRISRRVRWSSRRRQVRRSSSVKVPIAWSVMLLLHGHLLQRVDQGRLIPCWSRGRLHQGWGCVVVRRSRSRVVVHWSWDNCRCRSWYWWCWCRSWLVHEGCAGERRKQRPWSEHTRSGVVRTPGDRPRLDHASPAGVRRLRRHNGSLRRWRCRR